MLRMRNVTSGFGTTCPPPEQQPVFEGFNTKPAAEKKPVQKEEVPVCQAPPPAPAKKDE